MAPPELDAPAAARRPLRRLGLREGARDAVDAGRADAGDADAGPDGGGDDGGPEDGGRADGGGEDGSDGGQVVACERGGALITFRIANETLVVWITNDAFIEEALELLDSGGPRVPNFGDLHPGALCDPNWSWHPDPEDAEWADMTIELCDGVPSFVEDELEYWLGTVDQYCPWEAHVVAVDDRR